MPPKTNHPVRLGALVGILAAGLGPGGAVLADGPPPNDPRALRRTPAVEVFEQWKQAVVFVTGPVVKGDTPQAAEFFIAPASGPHESGVGTGFVLHESGYIVANAHAVEKLIFPLVVLSDGKRYPAELVASFRSYDLALLKINAGRPLKAVRLARSDDLMIGETVIVIANPHGLLYTCTTGVVSAVGRTTHLADVPGVTLQNLIQSDAAINPGSSGGPWFNVLGEVIGSTASMRKDAENIAFANSVATLRKLLPDMLDVGRRYGLMTGLEVAVDGPCQVTAVEPDSPAAKAGLRVHDVITKLGERPTPTSADFHLALVGRKPDETLTVEFLRDARLEKTSLVLGRRPKPDPAALLKKRLGLEAVPLDPQKAKAMGLRVPLGLVITAVDPRPYEKLEHRPRPGDVLARIGAIRPRDLDHAGLLLDKAPANQPIPLVFLRREGNVGTRIDINLAPSP
ncbi:MAG: S1C family serine protease [Thermoguttaceae bacterium]